MAMSVQAGDGFMPTLVKIREDANGCALCPLGKTATQPVLYRGSPTPRTLFIGEAPGQSEDEQGVPFVGAAGKELDAKITEFGIPPDSWAVVNTIMHRPPGNKYRLDYGNACRPFVLRLVGLLNPSKVVLLGRNAEDLYRDGVFGGRQIPTRAILHPAAVLYSSINRSRWNAQWEVLGPWLREK